MASELDRRAPFAAVLDVLSNHDPEGLLSAGAPADEYTLEADDFARRLRDSQQITGDVVVEVWERWFGPSRGYVRGATVWEFDALASALSAAR
ncbi:MAG: hypothetical protein ACRDRN_10900 [Sciscionella sp.]